MIQVTNVSKSFEGKKVLQGLNLTVQKGEIVGITGLRGCGKTTLMDIIAGVCQADGGTVEISGTAMDVESSSARLLVGYAPQETPAPRDMTPRGWLKFLSDARGLSSREANDRINETLKSLDLLDVSDESMPRLKDGALRMVNMAQASFYGPEALLIDEPTTGLDSKEIIALRQGIKSIAKDKATLLASSNLTELCALCDRVVVLRGGFIAAEGTVSELHNMAAATADLRLTLACDQFAAQTALKGFNVTDVASTDGCVALTVHMNGDQRKDIGAALVKANVITLGMEPVRTNLNDLIESLTSERIKGAGEA